MFRKAKLHEKEVLFKKEEVTKGYIIIRTGHLNSYIYFVVGGIVGVLYDKRKHALTLN